ncbi:hypothetical protein RRG08_003529 [Elysia crispata]|uniref:Uncharacterized protein n=1 Tax=Elysia crispata TaxID=231223 RepID=A0AAE0Y6Z4_9GAST|nr:hypothetical protein RRG08_003529 [Elysia crispata]
MACLSLGEPERWRGATQDDANVSQEGLRSAAILTQVSCPKDNGIYPNPGQDSKATVTVRRYETNPKLVLV